MTGDVFEYGAGYNKGVHDCNKEWLNEMSDVMFQYPDDPAIPKMELVKIIKAHMREQRKEENG